MSNFMSFLVIVAIACFVITPSIDGGLALIANLTASAPAWVYLVAVAVVVIVIGSIGCGFYDANETRKARGKKS